MLKQNKRLARRVRNLVALSATTAIILSVSTYAWFIGMRTVNVSSFDVEIKSAESLSLSLNGIDWSDQIAISEDNLELVSYSGHTNSWTKLIPMSSVGNVDPASSRMILFEKASLTTTPGGYRLLASRVKNSDTYATDPDGAGPIQIGDLKPEQEGYVAFDLFIRNYSGTQYIKEYEPLDEEAIYLTTDSAVKVAASGVAGSGIENSVRVAFAQIGRVAGTESVDSTITGIGCADTGDVTKICDHRTAQIWEPNDKDHEANAIKWYETACKARNSDGTDVTDSGSYAGACSTVVNGQTYPTYAISTFVTSGDNVDVYDGLKYNKYENSSKLVAFNTFTDTMKNYRGTERPTFMTLAPNSITKVRIYIYIEGQDIDNYDFASIGKKISVMFGFTKERFTEDDIQYNGPNVNQGEGPSGADKTVPVITLTGDSTINLAVDAPYNEQGATAQDFNNGTPTVVAVATTGTVNTHVAGTYTVTYRATDASGNTAVKTRTIIVQ